MSPFRQLPVLLFALLPTLAAAAEPEPYGKFTQILSRHVKSGAVDYKALKKKDGANLASCVADMAKVDASKLKGDAKMAYWINVYNAVTLKAIVDNYPLKSIRDLNTKKYDVWKDYRFGKQKINLNDIEHKILRPMGDPRIHSAIVCASKGCPPLRSEAYVPKRLDKQLDDNCRVWFQSPVRGMKWVGDTLQISSIFLWFPKDFGDGTRRGHLAWIASFVPDKALRAKMTSGKIKVQNLDWDWALNSR
jgi:hypothetical protein